PRRTLQPRRPPGRGPRPTARRPPGGHHGPAPGGLRHGGGRGLGHPGAPLRLSGIRKTPQDETERRERTSGRLADRAPAPNTGARSENVKPQDRMIVSGGQRSASSQVI